MESLLHDPSTYSTYPKEWHSLLQHLALSHSLIVLLLRNLPASAFSHSTLPFEDETGPSVQSLPFSTSLASLSSNYLPRSRMGSTAGSDAGSVAPTSKMPRHERLVEIVMPEPLAGQQTEETVVTTLQATPVGHRHLSRRSVGSISSVTSMAFGRKRSSSTATGSNIRANMSAKMTGPAAQYAAPILSGKAALPPVSYPNAKRYGFTRHGDPHSTLASARTSSDSARPGSVFSIQSGPSTAPNFRERMPSVVDRLSQSSSLPTGLPLPPSVGSNQRASFASSDAGWSSRRSEYGNGSPVQGRWGSPYLPRRDLLTPPMLKIEPAFERPPPYVPGQAPILRIFVPLGDRLQRWPSAEGAQLAIKEFDKCGATRRLKLGDLVVRPNPVLHI